MSRRPVMREYPNGTREWFIDVGRHREDGPAVEYADGSREWWIRDRLHREDGPAIEDADGNREWWRNGQLHREDGPAVEWVDGTREWWVLDQQLTEEEFNTYRFRAWAVEGRLIDISTGLTT